MMELFYTQIHQRYEHRAKSDNSLLLLRLLEPPLHIYRLRSLQIKIWLEANQTHDAETSQTFSSTNRFRTT